MILDKYWRQVADELRPAIEDNRPVVAPLEFSSQGFNVIGHTVEASNLSDGAYFVIHKGELANHSREALCQIRSTSRLTFANEVFVVFGPEEKPVSKAVLRHARLFFEQVEALKTGGLDLPKSKPMREMVYLGNNRALTRTVHGHKILVDTRDVSLAPHILLDGTWEPWITEVFKGIVKPGMNVVDIGSNVGYYPLIAASQIGPQGRLTCFEANPDLASLVYHNLEINGLRDRSEVVSKAVYSRSEVLNFKLFDKHLGSSSIWADDAHARAFHDTLRTIRVDAVSLDGHFGADRRIDFIRMDAEGAEPHIVKGAAGILTANKNIKVLMEWSPAAFQTSYGSVAGFYEELKALGFQVDRINPDSSLSPMSREDAGTLGHSDVLLERRA